MDVSVRRIIAGCLIFIMSACGPSDSSKSQNDVEIDLQPESISTSAKAWLKNESGVARRRDGLVIDIADGGALRRDVLRGVDAGRRIDLVMTLDANGDQSLHVRMAGGCGRDPVASEHEESVRLKPGYNRLTISNQFKENHTCFVVEFWAISGPVSLTIEDASIYWRD